MKKSEKMNLPKSLKKIKPKKKNENENEKKSVKKKLLTEIEVFQKIRIHTMIQPENRAIFQNLQNQTRRKILLKKLR